MESVPVQLTFQDVYALWNWKEIKNCPGRYVLKKREGNNLCPIQFIQKSIQKLYTKNEDNDGDKQYLYKINNDNLLELKETFGLKKDKISLIFFKDCGGIMTYQKKIKNVNNEEKIEDHDEHNNMIYIHTLNKPSGMLRKLSSMNVDYDYKQEMNVFVVKENK